MRFKSGLYAVLFGAITAGIVASTSGGVFPNNSWTNTSGGKWEDGTKWLLGAPPSTGQATIFVTNAASKAVTIDATTSGSFPGTMTIDNLFVGAPAGSVNTLSILNAGTNTPLHVLNSNILSNGGVLTISNSVFQADGLPAGINHIDGSAFVLDGGRMVATNTFIGSLPGTTGTLTLAAGGTAIFSELIIAGAVGATGTVWVTGGQLTVANSMNIGEPFGSAQMTISNGALSADSLFLGVASGADSSLGILTIAGGTNVIAGDLQIGSDAGSTGMVWMTGGQLIATNGGIYVSELGVGQLVVSNGTLLASIVTMGDGPGAQGNLIVAGGSTTMSLLSMSQENTTGTVWVSGGQLMVTGPVFVGEPFGSAQITVSNGTFSADSMLLGIFNGVDGSLGTLTVAGGTNVIASELGIGFDAGTTGMVWMTGGELIVTNGEIFLGDSGVGQMTVSNGTVNAGTVTVALNPGSAGTLTVAGGTLTADQLVATNSTSNIQFPAGNMTLHGAELRGQGILFSVGAAGQSAVLNLEGGTNQFADGFVAGSAANATGIVWVVDANLIVTNAFSFVASSGVGQMTVSNSLWQAGTVTVGTLAGSQAMLTLVGGTNLFFNNLRIGSGPSATGAVWMTGGQLAVTNGPTFVGQSGVGRMAISNGVYQALSVTVGANSGSGGTLTIAGGITTLSSALVVGNKAGVTGTVWVTGGELDVTNSEIDLGTPGVGRMIVSNGTLQTLQLALPNGDGARGEFVVAGGSAIIGDLPMDGVNNATGMVWVTGGQLTVANGVAVGEPLGSAQITVSNGAFVANSVALGVFNGVDSSLGTLTVAGGTSLITSNLTLGNFTCTATGVVAITGGNLFVTNAAGNATLEIQSGTLNISGGLLRVDRIVITNACAHFTRTGGTVIYGTAVLNPADDSDGDGFTNQQEINAGTDPLNPLSFPSPVTSWTDGTGKWEVSTNWSFGVPSSSFQAVFVTNAATKTITISSATPAINMTVSNLTVSGPAGTVNTLQITNVGLATPFTILNSLTNSSGGNVVVTNSLVRVQGVSGGTFVNNGTFTILGGGVLSNGVAMDVGSSANTTGSVWVTGTSAQLVVTNGTSTIGDFGAGQMTVSNGTWLTSSFVLVGFHSGSQGTLLLAGGTNILAGELDVGVAAGATGSVWMTGGSLNVGGEGLGVGDSGIGQMTVSNGTCQTVEMQVGISSGSDGTLTLAGGSAVLNVTGNLVAGSSSHSTGVVWLTAGQLITTNATAYAGNFGVGQITVSNGTWQAHFVEVGSGAGSHGTLTFAGGSISLAHLEVGTSANATGAVWMTGGQLIATNADVFIGDAGVGQMTVSNGTWLGRSVTLGDNSGSSSTLTLAGGTSTFSDILSISESNAVWVTGGQLNTTNQDTIVGEQGAGQMTVSNGTWQGSDVIVASGASSQGTLTVAGGTNSLGLVSIGNLSGATGTVWMTGGQLIVTNLPVFVGDAGSGRMTVSNGTMRAIEMRMGDISGSQGTLSVAGGNSSVYSDMIIGDSDCSATGIVTVAGGSLFVTNATHDAVLEVQTGTLAISGGLLQADKIVITNACAHFTRTGGTLVYGTAVLNPADDTDGDGFSNQEELNAGSDPLDPTSVPAGKLGVTPATLIFGTVTTGMTAQASFIVSNSAVGLLSGSATVTGGPFAIVSGSPFSVPANGSTNVVVRFAPISAGAFTNTVIFNAGIGGVSSNTVAGTGAVVPVASFTATPTNGVVPLTVTFTNTSTGTITNDVWDFGDTVTSHTTATVLTHTYNAAGNYGVSLIAQGPVGVSTNTKPNLIQALNPPHLMVAPASRDYGTVTVGLTNTLPFSVINTGDLALTGTVATVLPFAISGASSYTVQPGQTGTVQVSFIPTSSGSFSNNVVFGSNGGVSTNGVTGAATSAGHISVSPVALDFGTIATGAVSQRVFVVSNGGGTTVTNGTTAVGAPFAILSGQQFSVPALGSTNVVVEFAPSSAGAFTNPVVFATANGGSSTSQVTGAGATVPVANFTTTPTNGVVPLTVTFTNTSTGTITNDVWNFGDTVTSNTTATVLMHTYNTAGSYGVTLIALGPVGVSTNSKPNLIHALNPPHLMVAPASRDYGTVTVSLTNTLPFSVINTGDLALTGTVATASPFAISGASSYTVQPGQTGTVQVSFIPTSAGAFSNNVVFSSNGGVSTNGLNGTAASVGHISVSPVASDFGTIATGTVSQRVFVVSNSGGTTVTNGTTAVGAPFAILSGQQFSVPALGSTNVVVEFAPSSAGAFTNPVVFATANGGSSTNQVTGTAAIAPAANFTAAPTNGAAPLLVNFTDASTGAITNRLWSFGDSGTSTLTSPSHTYSNAGVYSVSLTVFGPAGSSATNGLNLITVTNVVPMASFTADPTNGAAPLLVSFSDTSTGTITNRLWMFGDGTTSTASITMHTYTTAGVYSVSLTVFGPGGSDTLNQPGLVTVTSAPPKAGFTANPTNGVAPLQVSFTDASNGTITNRLWDFGDGGSSMATSPSHTYTNAGNFSVTLTVFGPAGMDASTQPELIIVTSGSTNADLEVIKVGSPNPVFVASNLTYTITVTNHGPAAATSITLTDALPTSVIFLSASDECTNTGGIVVCDLGSLDAGGATNVTLVVVPTVAGKLTNTASVAATEIDPVPANNTVTNTLTVTVPPLGTNDLAVVKLKAPKKIALSAKTPSKVGKFSVTIQNLGPQTETIPDLAALSNLVNVAVLSLGTNCASFAATLAPPKAPFPINIAPNKKLTLVFTAIFNCANDPLASSKTASHADYRTTATVDLGALGEVDTTTSNDLCPRPPNGSDPGCGNKDPITKQLGADVLTDVVVKP